MFSKHGEIGNNCNRINKIKPFLKHFNFENINYPLKKKIIKHLKEIMSLLL